MKINTKKATPVKNAPNCYINENPAYPNDVASGYESDGLGRERLFHTLVVSTPVLASSRIHNKQCNSSGRKSFLSDHDVTCLTNEFKTLYVGSPLLKVPDKVSAKVEHDTRDDRSNEENKSIPSTPVLGIIEKIIFSFKANKEIKVKRSARLASKA